MSGTLVTALVVALAAVAAVYALKPAPGAPATAQYYAIAAFVLLVLGLVAVLSEWLRRRRAARSRPPSDLLLDPSNRREAFRIPYPAGGRPILRLEAALAGPRGLVSLEVLDVAEEGLRLCVPEGACLEGRVGGHVVFPGGETAAVVGEVVRCGGGEAALRLSRALPSRLLVEEQRRLRDHLKPRQP